MNSCSGSGSAAVVPNCYQSTFFLVVSPQRRRRRRSKPSLITVNCMNPHPTNFNLLRQNIVFSYSERIPVSFSWLFHSFSFFFFLLFYVLINFYKNYVIIIIILLFFFRENYFYFFMFRDVPECSGMFRNVPCSGFYRRPSVSVQTCYEIVPC